MMINVWGMSEQGLHGREEQDVCAMPNTNWSHSQLGNTGLHKIKNMDNLCKMVNHVALIERGCVRAKN